MFALTSSAASANDYGHIDYSPKTVQTASFSNGKVWSERNPPVLTGSRFDEQNRIINALFETEVIPAIEVWIAEVNEQTVELQEIAKSKDAKTLEAASIQKQNTMQAIQHLRQSLMQMELFLAKLTPHLRPDFLPSVAVDNEGEIGFEWYGRQGARASVIVGANGVLYFVSLFHGSSMKSRLLWNNDIPPIILTELDKIYKDKQA